MKRVLTLILALAFLILPFSALAATPTAARTDSITVRMPETDYKAFANAYCKKYGYKYTESYAKAFKYALSALPEDYSKVDKSLPANLYQHPYSTWADAKSIANYKKNFKTNAQLIKAIGAKDVALIMKAAKGYEILETNIDYSRIDENAFKSAIFYYLPTSDEKSSYVDNIIKEAKDYKVIKQGAFITDPSLVYQAADGMYRVRGRVVLKYNQASKDFFEDGIKADTWYYFDIEFCMVKNSSKVKGKYEHGKYEHGKYVLDSWIAISNGWNKANSSLVALAMKHMA